MTQLHPQAKTTSLPATFFVPEFLRLEKYELGSLLHVLRDPLATHVFLLLQAHSDFKTGEFLGGYHRLMELCTPPQPERGPRRPGPSYWQLRRVIDDLIKLALAKRDETQNALQGQLRLQLTPREKIAAPVQLHSRELNRVAKGRKSKESTSCDAPAENTPQDKPQGCQGVNTPLIPQTSEVIHSPVTPQGRKAGIEALKALKGTITRPPKGAQKAPQQPVGAPTSFVSAGDLFPRPTAPGE